MQVLEIRKPEELSDAETLEFLKMDPYVIRASIVDAFNWGGRGRTAKYGFTSLISTGWNSETYGSTSLRRSTRETPATS